MPCAVSLGLRRGDLPRLRVVGLGKMASTSNANNRPAGPNPTNRCALLVTDTTRFCFRKRESIQETLYPLSIPGMRESIKEGLETPIEECDEELDW